MPHYTIRRLLWLDTSLGSTNALAWVIFPYFWADLLGLPGWLSARPTGGESSTGLGLSIIKTLSQRLHGDVQVESKLGDGSKFTLIVPLDEPKG